MIYVLPKELAGVFAMWAIRQSPYLVPENLAECITEFVAGFECTQPVLEWKCPLEFMQAIKDSIFKSPSCLKLNERKNGREGMGFCSLYDRQEADDDFIDLDALTRNIFRTVVATQDAPDNAKSRAAKPSRYIDGLCLRALWRTEMTDYKSMFEQVVRALAAIDEALGIGDDRCGDPDQTLTAIENLKELARRGEALARAVMAGQTGNAA